MDERDLRNRFTYHAPSAENDQPARYERIRAGALDFALLINDLCPESRRKDLAIDNLEDAVMRANQSIAVNE